MVEDTASLTTAPQKEAASPHNCASFRKVAPERFNVSLSFPGEHWPKNHPNPKNSQEKLSAKRSIRFVCYLLLLLFALFCANILVPNFKYGTTWSEVTAPKQRLLRWDHESYTDLYVLYGKKRTKIGTNWIDIPASGEKGRGDIYNRATARNGNLDQVGYKST